MVAREERTEMHPPKTNPSLPPGSWRGSSHSLLSPALSCSSSPPRLGIDSQLLANSLKPCPATMEMNDRPISDRSKSNVRRGLEYLLTQEEPKRTASVDSQGMTIEDYVILADIPRLDLGSEGEGAEVLLAPRRRTQSPSPRRDQRHRTPRYVEESDSCSTRVESDERGRGRERGRDRREKEKEKYCDSEDGRLSRTQSTTDLQPQRSDNQTRKGLRSSKPRQRVLPESTQTQSDLKGWMSKLDEYGEWRRHWFVMRDAALSFYMDSEAEESDDLDGEIDLTTCMNVQDFDVEKNYGFQIHTKKAVFTLSASTSRIRRKWVNVLRRTIQPRHSSDITPRSDSERENSQPVSSRQPPSVLTCEDSDPQTTNSTSNLCQMDSLAPDLDDTSPNMSSDSQREAGEGWDREQAKRFEERNRWFEGGIPFREMGSRWDSLDLKKAGVPVPVTHTMDVDVNNKWVEFESLTFREMSALSLIGAQTNQTNQMIPNQTIQTTSATALQREALSLRQQVECLRKERVEMGMEVVSLCGPWAPCGQRLEAMEAAHRRALMELQESHAREVRELQRQRLLQEESQATAQVEALKEAHREELEREVEKARRMTEGGGHMDTTHRGQTPQADALHSELDVLSERYSQKCLELNRAEQRGGDRETELSWKDREMEQLRRENQELQARLTEEISRMRHFITGQRSGNVSPGNFERSPSELEMLLRAKEIEVGYLQKEIGCLRNEVQSLTKEKQSLCDRYKEVYVELIGMKGHSELEIRDLREHLRLTNAALHEGRRDT
ncbi:TRIO and F-actin-binding protein isoform X2 [Oncorhynchus tshawytscha]|uniref:TRIO and F-actin-binding protein isoform X2 n=1 Tax=Oncorhynchus tshawytscha TaxID=74940 RepID=UPI001C3D9745|nr:TRIO and F-actin-binding protein isoform X2 [Oncorhynchus tshawytscha]